MPQTEPRILEDEASDDLSPVRVVSIPAGHPYVERISAASGISVLPDPPVAGAAPGQWWPPAAFDPAWIARSEHDADVLHIHFGIESFPPGHVSACLAAARRAGWATVYTAHDLDNPQVVDQSAHLAQLGELMAEADVVTTLTHGAAAQISERWGREAVVIPHPSILPSAATVPRVLAFGDVRIGTHLKDLRPNVDAPATVRALRDAVAELRASGVPAVAEVRMHHAVRDEAARAAVRELCEGDDAVVLLEHERLSDRELVVALERLDVCVLPYVRGTHSGWLELCWDLGVPVAAPAVGFFAEQHVDDTVASFAAGDSASLASALRVLLAADGSTRTGSTERFALIERRRAGRARSDAAAADAHAELYRRALSERRA